MKIHIKSIHIHKAGPLDSISFELGKMNLFFGHNETGKTYLVEFILRSLFKHRSTWSIRETTFEGSLIIEGITDQPTTFSPAGPNKMEDYLTKSELGLPRNLSRLLIVKGGELDLTENVPGGVDRDVLKTALTNQEIFDHIWQRIPITIRKSSLVNQEIIGNNQGRIKDLNQGKKYLDLINKLIDSVEELYSKGPAKQLELKIDNHKDLLKEQRDAKRHLAYQISERHKNLIKEREKYSNIFLENIRDLIRDYRTKQKDADELTDQIRKTKKESEDYLWIKAGAEIWETNQLDTIGKTQTILGYAGLVLICAGIIALILNETNLYPLMFWPSVTALFLGSGFLAYNFFNTLSRSRSRDVSVEKDNIKKGFRERFDFSPNNLADIKKQKDVLHETYLFRKNDQTQLDQKHIELKGIKFEIDSLFINILQEEIEEKKWDETYQDLYKKSTTLQNQIHQTEIDLNKINIPEEEYNEGPSRVSFDLNLEEKLNSELSDLTSELNSYYQKMDTIKNQVCEVTGLEIETPWPEAYHGLLRLQDEHIESLKEITAELIAKIGLTEILQRIQSEEDQKINQDINTSNVLEIMRTITGKYQKIGLSEDQIFVEDQYRRYGLSDLSTGAIEQIQLSLRLGIASLIAKDNPLFLVLDDAFQHSDWDRRDILVKSTIKLAEKGWQVIYLTMDDHIRDLFLKLGKTKLGNEFSYFEL